MGSEFSKTSLSFSRQNDLSLNLETESILNFNFAEQTELALFYIYSATHPHSPPPRKVYFSASTNLIRILGISLENSFVNPDYPGVFSKQFIRGGGGGARIQNMRLLAFKLVP